MSDYATEAIKLLGQIQQANAKTVNDVALRMKAAVDGGGLIFVFGSGHSSILTEEAFHRAGGLIPVSPILHSFLSPHTPPAVSGRLERLEGVASILFNRAGVGSADFMWIASNSGINAAAIEMALECKKAGVAAVALTNLSHSRSTNSRHSSGKKLYELCDLVLDNMCPPGDALAEISEKSGSKVRVGAGSTIANCFLFNWSISAACSLWAAEGKTLPVYRSANVPGGDAHNEKAEAPYRSRIRFL